MPLEVRAQQVSNVDLCRAVYYAPAHVGMVAREEATRRGINCIDYMAAVVQQEQARATAAPAPVYQPIPMPQNTYQVIQPRTIAPPTINCSTYRLGNRLETSCN